MNSDLNSLLLWLSTFWGLLHLLRYHRRRTARNTFLPAPSAAGHSTSPDLFKTRTTRITLHALHLGLASTAWNGAHTRLCTRVRRSSALARMYDVGAVLGVLGMCGAVGLLLWTVVRMVGGVWERYTVAGDYEQEGQTSGVLHKRDFTEGEESVRSEPGGRAPLQLIIPGVTTPLHHLPVLLIALLATQVVHEAGHAVAAAVDSIPLSSAGLGITVILPSAFVAFPAGETDSLPTRARTRIISAGAFHNLLLWAFLSFLAWMPISDVVWPVLGYRNVRGYGRVVVGVDVDSPLYDHVPVGAVIYQVGDDALAQIDGADPWVRVLTQEASSPGPVLGWCADEPWFVAHSQSCCLSDSGGPAEACFSTRTPEGNVFERCLDPLAFLDPDERATVRRCESAVDCGKAEFCVRPRGDQGLVVLKMHIPLWLRAGGGGDAEHTVVWQGARWEILQELEVGDWLPASRILPMALPELWALLFSYMKMLTLSLYFFNLLPIPRLDGGQLLDALSEWSDARQGAARASDDSFQMEAALERGADEDGDGRVVAAVAAMRDHRGSRRAQKVKGRRRRAVHIGVGVLLGTCVVLGLVEVYQ